MSETAKKTSIISPNAFEELSFVKKSFNGLEYAPRNQSARILGTKAAPVETTISLLPPESVAAAAAAAKAAADNAPENAEKAMGMGKWDGLASVVAAFYNDWSSIQWLSDDDARDAAIDALMTNFLAAVDAQRPDAAEKAGARHSAADAKHIGAIKDAAATITDHATALTTPVSDTSDNDDADGDDEDVAGKAKAAAKAAPLEGDAKIVQQPDIAALLNGFKADVATMISDAAKATDAKIAAIEVGAAAKAAATATTQLDATIAAVKAATKPSAPGGAGDVGTDFSTKSAPTVEEQKTVLDPRDQRSMTPLGEKIEGTGSFVRRNRAHGGA